MTLNLDESKIREFLFLKMIFDDGAYSISRIGPNLQRIETELMNAYRLPGDTSDTLNQRFAEAIQVPKTHAVRGGHFDNLITKRLLFAYYKKYRTLTPKRFTSQTVTVEEVTAPISEVDQEEFKQFCIALSY